MKNSLFFSRKEAIKNVSQWLQTDAGLVLLFFVALCGHMANGERHHVLRIHFPRQTGRCTDRRTDRKSRLKGRNDMREVNTRITM